MVALTPKGHRIQVISGIIAALTIFLIIILIPGFHSEPLTTLDAIKKRGRLDVLTLNSATTYFQDIEAENGFEYQLVSWFAESIGVVPRFKIVSEFADLYPELLFGSGDLAAAGLSDKDSKYSQSVAYGPRYHEVANQILYRKGNVERPKSVADLIGGSLKVISGTAHVEQLHALQQNFPELTWIEADKIASEELIEQLDTGEINYILADSHEVALQRRYFPELRIAFEIAEPRQLRWAYNHGKDDSLGQAINDFFAQIEIDGRLEQLIHRHYSQVAKFNYSDIQTFTQRIESHLPRYQAMFEREGSAFDIDWRLLASIGYQESLWIERAKSPTGVRGLMMLTQSTAKQVKVKNRLDPAESIRGGAKYFTSVLKRIPKQIEQPDRTWMALAAYNVGLGHVEDARVITQKRGGDPNRWIDVKQSLPLLARKKWYKSTKYGYARGWEPVKYVANIRQYYDYLVGIENRAIRDSSEIEVPREEDQLAPSL